MLSIYDLIDIVRVRPGMYIGSNEAGDMRRFLDGVTCAIEIFGNATYGEPTFLHFGSWVCRRFDRPIGSEGWYADVLRACDGDEREALKLFFSLIDEFRACAQFEKLSGRIDKAAIEDERATLGCDFLTIDCYLDVGLFVVTGEWDSGARSDIFGAVSTLDQAKELGSKVHVEEWTTVT